MEPIITYIVASFFGYYVAADFLNQFIFTREMSRIKYKLDKIEAKLK
jgi:hypothetical protein